MSESNGWFTPGRVDWWLGSDTVLAKAALPLVKECQRGGARPVRILSLEAQGVPLELVRMARRRRLAVHVVAVEPDKRRREELRRAAMSIQEITVVEGAPEDILRGSAPVREESSSPARGLRVGAEDTLRRPAPFHIALARGNLHALPREEALAFFALMRSAVLFGTIANVSRRSRLAWLAARWLTNSTPPSQAERYAALLESLRRGPTAGQWQALATQAGWLTRRTLTRPGGLVLVGVAKGKKVGKGA